MFSCILVPTCRYSHFHNLAQWTGDQTWSGVYNWASEASPTLGCSIEISRDIYIYVVGMSRMSN